MTRLTTIFSMLSMYWKNSWKTGDMSVATRSRRPIGVCSRRCFDLIQCITTPSSAIKSTCISIRICGITYANYTNNPAFRIGAFLRKQNADIVVGQRSTQPEQSPKDQRLILRCPMIAADFKTQRNQTSPIRTS